MATSRVFALRLSFLFSFIYLYTASVEPVGGCSIMTRLDYTFSEEWGGYYKMHGQSSTWQQARIACEDEGTVLATPYTLKATEVLRDIVNEHQIAYGIFIGAKDTTSQGDYRTIEGISLCQIPHRWTNKESNSTENTCLVLLTDGTFTNEPCTSMLPFVCYKKHEECNTCQNQCKTSDSAYKFSQRTGSCYKFHNTARQWVAAVKTCNDEGGHLAIINSKVEANILKDMFVEYPHNDFVGAHNKAYMFVGFHNLIQGWMNIDGKNLTASGYNSWEPNEPNNWQKNNEGCGSMYRTGLLNDINCLNKFVFICEIETQPIYV